MRMVYAAGSLSPYYQHCHHHCHIPCMPKHPANDNDQGRVAQLLTMSENEFKFMMGLFEKIIREETEFLYHVSRAIYFVLIVGWCLYRGWIRACHFRLSLIIKKLPFYLYLHLLGQHSCHPLGSHLWLTWCGWPKSCMHIGMNNKPNEAAPKQIIYLQLQSKLLLSLGPILLPENIKWDSEKWVQNVWEKGFTLVDLECRFLTLGIEEDEELLHDKERVPKQPKVDPASAKLPGLRIRTYGGDLVSPSTHPQITIQPKREQAIANYWRLTLGQKPKDFRSFMPLPWFCCYLTRQLHQMVSSSLVSWPTPRVHNFPS